MFLRPALVRLVSVANTWEMEVAAGLYRELVWRIGYLRIRPYGAGIPFSTRATVSLARTQAVISETGGSEPGKQPPPPATLGQGFSTSIKVYRQVFIPRRRLMRPTVMLTGRSTSVRSIRLCPIFSIGT